MISTPDILLCFLIVSVALTVLHYICFFVYLYYIFMNFMLFKINMCVFYFSNKMVNYDAFNSLRGPLAFH